MVSMDFIGTIKPSGLTYAEERLRSWGLTPEILEDARAVAWVEEHNVYAEYSCSRIEDLRKWKVGFRTPAYPTLREAVAKAKEADRG